MTRKISHHPTGSKTWGLTLRSSVECIDCMYTPRWGHNNHNASVSLPSSTRSLSEEGWRGIQDVGYHYILHRKPIVKMVSPGRHYSKEATYVLSPTEDE